MWSIATQSLASPGWSVERSITMDIDIAITTDGLFFTNDKEMATVNAQTDLLKVELTRAVEGVLDTFRSHNHDVEFDVSVTIDGAPKSPRIAPTVEDYLNEEARLHTLHQVSLYNFVHKFASGWSAKREVGLVTLPSTAQFAMPGSAVFAQNKWVLRNKEGEVVDMCRDRGKMFDRYPESRDWLDVETRAGLTRVS
jgi:hypothetical protein